MKKIILPLVFLVSGLLFSQTRTHTVQPKETVYGLSKQYNVTQEALKAANPFLYDRELQIGDVLTIPNGNANEDTPPPTTENDSNNQLQPVNVQSYEDDEFYFRVIKPKETLYSLSKEYQVTQEAIKSLNPFIEERGLQIGDVVRIAREKNLTNNKDPKGLHQVKPGETVYTIAKQNNIKPADIYAANRQVQLDGLKADTYIKIPSETNVKVENSQFNHVVKSKETIFSILRKYDITLTELLESNPELTNGLKAGMTLQIPIANGAKMADLEMGEADQMLASDYDAARDDQINVAMILPFYLNKPNAFKGERDIAKEFYMGAQVALNELISRGKKVNVKIIDSENNNATIDNFIKSNEIYKYDALIGPFFQDGLIHTAQTLDKLNLPIFSPVINTPALESFENIYLPTPKDEFSADIIAEEIGKNYTGVETIKLLTTTQEKGIAEYLKASLEKNLNAKDVQIITNANDLALEKETVVGKDVNGNETKVEVSKPGISVLVSENVGLGKQFVDKILKEDITKMRGYSVYFVPAIDVFDASNAKNINKLKEMKFVYTASRMINSFGQNEKEILTAFNDKFCQLPTKYMAMGYDIMYDVVDRMNRSGYISNFDQKRVETRLSGKYGYEKSENGKAKVNKSIRIIRLN